MTEPNSSPFSETNAPLPEEQLNSSGPPSRIVDFAAFEHQKENIQPLRRGRAASTLAMLYGTPVPTADGENINPEPLNSMARQSLQPARPLGPEPPQQQAAEQHNSPSEIKVTGRLQAQNAQFQAEIAAIDPVETEDPLDVYYRYIQWLFEVFPQASGHQAIIKLVETPLTLFRGQERYRNDARYVKMWLWYTGLIHDGQEAVFQYLLSNKIGDSLAVLYEEYAKLLESRGKTPRADKIFQLGIARKAQPLARLERRHVEFQRRVMARTMQNIEREQHQQHQQQSGRGIASSHENAERTMLGTKRSSRATRSVAANTLSASHRGLPDQQQQQQRNTTLRPNSRIAVFSDPGGNHADSMSANSENSHSDDATPWRDVGSDEWRRKENMPEATSWRGQTLEQRRTLRDGAPGTPAIGKFAVFCDDTGDAFSAASAQILDTTEPVGCVSSALTPRRNRSQAVHTTVENLLNSFDNLDTPSTNRTRHMVKGKSKQLAGKHPERMVMPADMLFPHGGDVPQCVEEARAQLARYAFDYEAWHEDEQRKLKAIEAERVAVSATKLGREALQRSNIPLNDDDYNDDEDDEDDEDDGIADESASPSLLGKRKAAASSPTINTRAAQEGMLEIWNDMSNSDSDSESLQGLQPKTKLSKLSSVVDDDYQFTMGPVAPNIMPEGLAEKPAVIPSSTRSTRFRSFQDNADASSRIAKDENDPPTLMLRGVHPFTQPDMMTPKAKATPLAARSQSRPLSGAATVGVVRRRQPHFRTSSVDEGDAPLISKTPIAQRVSVFKDSSPLHPSLSPILDSEPSPLFVSSADAPSTPAPLGKRFAVFSDSPSAVSDVVDANNADVHQDVCGSKDKPSGVYYSTPAHGRAHFVGRSSLLTPAQRPVSNSAYPQTPGHTANASGYLSGSGAELTGVTGFTGLSSIGSSTALLLRGELDIESERVAGAGNNHTDDDEQHSEDPVAHTPVRKRLSMAVRDLGNITPRFPKSPTDANSHFMGLDDDDEDEDEDEDGEDDEDEPHTENIGEFGNLDSQMHALQAEFGGGRFAHPNTPAQQQERPFSVFRD